MNKIILSVLMVLIIGCNQSYRKDLPPEQKPADVKLKDFVLADSTRYLIQEIENLVGLAEQSLEIEDSLGAVAFYENALTLLNEKNDSTRTFLLNDTTFINYIENKLKKPYKLISEKLNVFEADTTSTDDVQSDLNNYLQAETLADEQVQFTDSSEFHIPHTMNKKVQLAIKYFTQTPRGRRVMERWLARTGKYEHIIKPILREVGVPEDLFYLAMIESGLNPKARSYARAVGIWQFISATGRAYGLNHSFWYDERSDVIKATYAAARHLKDLYNDFNDWYLALAGYNFSPRKLKRKIRYSNASEFWEVKHLPRQTRNYVPTFLAARHIAKNSESYGFFVEKEKPLLMDTVHIHESIDLSIVAKLVDTTYAAIRDMNPAVKRWVTPPDVKSWVLYIPKGTKEKFIEGYKQIPDSEKRHYVRHKVRYGQTLSHLSYKYGVPIWLIKKTNHLRGNTIRVGQNLIIPVPHNRKEYYRSAQHYASSPRRTPKSLPKEKGKEKVVYVVKEGDNLFDIALKYGVTISKLRYWNGLQYKRYIYPGQKLNIWLSPEMAGIKSDGNEPVVAASQEKVSGANSSDMEVHIVRRGDTLWDIAKKYNTSISQLKRWNNKRNNKIKPGEKLIIYKIKN
ncbi:MAG: hypothetical protein Kow00108_06360 [Calditrichia bacterium]